MNYNRQRYVDGKIQDLHLNTLVRIAQGVLRLKVDGKCGPKTLAALEARAAQDAQPDFTALDDLEIVDGWLQGVTEIKAHGSWFTRRLDTGTPKAIVAHYSATAGGTAENMARRRTVKRKATDRAASWHVSIERDGQIIQMIPFTGGAWHSHGLIDGVGTPNLTSIGIELIGHGVDFPPAQVESAARVWRALVQTYGILRGYAMIPHSQLDPARRSDPGPLWMARYAPPVLDFACK